MKTMLSVCIDEILKSLSASELYDSGRAIFTVEIFNFDLKRSLLDHACDHI